MTTGKVPTKMKYAKVIPVYKSKDNVQSHYYQTYQKSLKRYNA